MGATRRRGCRWTLLIPFSSVLRRDLRAGAMSAIKSKRTRRAVVISGQKETNNFGLNSLFVSMPA
jgi:hypothetical protein